MRKYLRNPEAFVTSLKKKRVEVSLKNLTAGEKEMMAHAKGREIKYFLKEHVVSKLQEGEIVPKDQIMRMRWIVTWKRQEDGEKRGEARLAVLGFEDPFLGQEDTCLPTLQNCSKQMLLQICAQNNWKLQKGDVTAAFLQGNEMTQRKYALAPPQTSEERFRADNSTGRTVPKSK